MASDLIALPPPDDRLLIVHNAEICASGPCPIHSPSDHPLNRAPLSWREDRQFMERLCWHGIGHPDPDDVRVRAGHGVGTHGCDGCCGRADEPVTWRSLLAEMREAGWHHVMARVYFERYCEHIWTRGDSAAYIAVGRRHVTFVPDEPAETGEFTLTADIARSRGPAWLRQAMVLAGVLPASAEVASHG